MSCSAPKVKVPSSLFLRATLSLFPALLAGAMPAQAQSPYHLPELPQRVFHADRLPAWLAFDGQLRGRTEEQSALGYVSGKDRLYELTRLRGGVTLRPLSWFTFYAQFQDTHALGLPDRDQSSNMRDAFDLFEGYLDLHHGPLTLWTGRRVMRFGDERVVGVSNWTNNSRSFDGFHARIGDSNRLDLFSTSVVQTHPESLDTHGAGLTFHGAWANVTTLLPHTSLQPFLLVHAVPRVVSPQHIAGTQTEVTPGFGFDTKLPGHFSATGLGDLQRGSYANQTIHAGAGLIKGAYTAPGRFSPEIEGEYDYATGNRAANPLIHGTYDQEYPSNHNAFGLVDLFGFENMKEDRLNLSFVPHRNATVLLQGGSLHIASTTDGLYNGSGTRFVKAPAGGFAHDGIGSEFDASGTYRLREDVVAEAGVGHFFPGYAMTHTGHAAALTLAYFQLTWRPAVGH